MANSSQEPEPVARARAALAELEQMERVRRERAAALADAEAGLAAARQAAAAAEVEAALGGKHDAKRAQALEAEVTRLAAAVERHQDVLRVLDQRLLEARAGMAEMAEGVRGELARRALAIEAAAVEQLRPLVERVAVLQHTIRKARDARNAGRGAVDDWDLRYDGRNLLAAFQPRYDADSGEVHGAPALPTEVESQLAVVRDLDTLARRAEQIARDHERSPEGRAAREAAEAERLRQHEAEKKARQEAEIRAEEERREREWQARQEEIASKKGTPSPTSWRATWRVA